jgi:hypothetical protein
VAVTPTMPAEQPRIVKRQDGRHLPVEPLQRSQVEIAAVEVVAVNHVRSGRREIEEVVRSRELEVFPSADLFHEGAWMRGKSARSAQPSPARAGRPARHPVESLLKRRIPGHAVDGPAIIREREDIRVVAHRRPTAIEDSWPRLLYACMRRSATDAAPPPRTGNSNRPDEAGREGHLDRRQITDNRKTERQNAAVLRPPSSVFCHLSSAVRSATGTCLSAWPTKSQALSPLVTGRNSAPVKAFL